MFPYTYSTTPSRVKTENRREEQIKTDKFTLYIIVIITHVIVTKTCITIQAHLSGASCNFFHIKRTVHRPQYNICISLNTSFTWTGLHVEQDATLCTKRLLTYHSFILFFSILFKTKHFF